MFTDAYDIYAPLEAGGSQHKTVHQAAGEYARAEPGDGFLELPVLSMDGFWSLVRSWLRPHPGSALAQLP